jgi:hypothetical protein
VLATKQSKGNQTKPAQAGFCFWATAIDIAERAN